MAVAKIESTDDETEMNTNEPITQRVLEKFPHTKRFFKLNITTYYHPVIFSKWIQS